MEDFVSFEQAQKLKDLGFDWTCREYYNKAGIFKESFDGWDYNNVMDYIDVACSAPTLAQVAKWLREKGIYMKVIPYSDCLSRNFIGDHAISLHWDNGYLLSTQVMESYEKALSSAIDLALELLKQ